MKTPQTNSHTNTCHFQLIISKKKKKKKKKKFLPIEKLGMEENGKPAQKREANTKLPEFGSSDATPAPISPYNPGSCFEGNLNNNVSNT
jgi:hypothetical protein